MKNSPEVLEAVRKMATELNEKDPGPAWVIMLDLMDDIDTLTEKLKARDDLLVRADTIIKVAILDVIVDKTGREWIADLAALSEGEKG